jgi:uncharacterized protein DUF4169
MSEIVNLKRARKGKARAAAEQTAAANRLAHGRTKAEKEKTRAQAHADQRKLDGNKRDDA